MEKLKTQKLQCEQLSLYIKDQVRICASIENTLPKRIFSTVDKQQPDTKQTKQSHPNVAAKSAVATKRGECVKLRYISLDGEFIYLAMHIRHHQIFNFFCTLVWW